MKTMRIFTFAAFIAASVPVWGAAFDVDPQPKRAGTMAEAERLLSPTEPAALPQELKHPFFPGTVASASAAEADNVGAPKSDLSVLETIASKLSVSGTLVMGDQRYLLIRQKKLKVGDRLAITLDDREYEVVMTAITRSTYTLRLNEAELSLSIVTKPESRNEN
jgi:hypothetical protein